jgi:transcriptional regulator with XRE-family HTH domain
MRYEFGARLKKYREAKGLSQKEFAALIGVGNTRVSNWELGTNRPDVDFLPKICEVLGVVPSDLLGVKKEPPAPGGAGVDASERVKYLLSVADRLPDEDFDRVLDLARRLDPQQAQ